MTIRTCFLLGFAVGLIGLVLRAALPVTPVDAGFREVVSQYAAMPH